jgi:hypothetical protein
MGHSLMHNILKDAAANPTTRTIPVNLSHQRKQQRKEK